MIRSGVMKCYAILYEGDIQWNAKFCDLVEDEVDCLKNKLNMTQKPSWGIEATETSWFAANVSGVMPLLTNSTLSRCRSCAA